MKKKVYIVEDHPMMLEGYMSVINRTADLEVCGQADASTTALSGILVSEPDVIIVDLSLKDGQSGIELIKHLKAVRPRMTVLVVSGMDERLFAERALRAGARGYVQKNEAGRAIVDAIHQILRGELYMSRQLREELLQRKYAGYQAGIPESHELLSDREMEVYTLIGRGMNVDEIARVLMISHKTVSTYRTNIKQKLGLSSTTELTHRAISWMNSSSREGIPL